MGSEGVVGSRHGCVTGLEDLGDKESFAVDDERASRHPSSLDLIPLARVKPRGRRDPVVGLELSVRKS